MELSVQDICKRYGNLVALDHVTVTLRPGVIGLLGPNGAGKSTLLRILATVSRPTEGQLTWNGLDALRHPDALRRVLGYLPQDFGVYPHLNAVEFLEYMAAAKGVPRQGLSRRIADLLAMVNLSHVARRPLYTYSGGMRQRIGIAQALLNNPAILLLDEPTAGLDPAERVHLRRLLVDLARDRIVLLSTHIVGDIESVADRVVVIARGRIRADGTPDQLLQAAAGMVWEQTVTEQEYEALRQRQVIAAAVRRRDGVHVRVVGAAPPAEHFWPATPTLEDAYLLLIRDLGSESR